METSDFIGEDEALMYVDKAWQEFYLLMVGQFDNLCVKSGPTSITTSAGTSTYGLPNDFLKAKMLELTEVSTGRTLHLLRPLSSIVEMVPFRMSGQRGRPTHYFLSGSPDTSPAPGNGSAQIILFPTPDSSTYQAQLWYVPNLSLGDLEGNYGLAMVAGWDEYVIITAAMKMKDKEESDCTVLMAERSMLWDNMKRVLTPTDESEPPHVIAAARPHGYSSFEADPYFAEGTF